ncbi:MAG TPA: anti-sigma regulatory factor [Limnochordia bacterium]|nr:anti-sigma regulatory factor [Limnochordia bacterium]
MSVATENAPRVRFLITGADEVVIVSARGAARELARELGFGIVDQTRIATAVSEITRNAVQYSSGGEVTLAVVRRGNRMGLRIDVADEGPGIADVERVLQGGYSTGNGFGRGISGAKALMDQFVLESRLEQGTHISMIKWRD